MVLRSQALVALFALIALLLLAGSAEARRPVVAYVDQGKRLRLYDTEIAADVPAPVLTIEDPVRGFAMSHDGRFVVYTDAAKKVHLYDRADAGDRVIDGVEGTPRSVSDAGSFATDGADNGPTRVYDRTGAPIAVTGLDKHRQGRISGDGRVLATTCNDSANCVADSGGDSDLYVHDLGADKDTGLADDALTGTAGKDDEHPCVDGDGSLVGADVNVGNMDHDIAVYDRAAGQRLDLSSINAPGTDLTYCALDATGGYIGFGDRTTGAASVYERATGTLLVLPPNAVFTPIWLTQPYAPPPPPPAPPAATPPAAVTPKPGAAKVLSKLRVKRRARKKGLEVRVTFSVARRRTVRVAIGRLTKGRFRSLVSTKLKARRGKTTVRLRPRGLAPGVYVVRVSSGKDSRMRSVRIGSRRDGPSAS
jgi:hypothetical protein